MHQRGARYELRGLVLIFADGRDGDHVALIRAADQHAAIERLDPLGIGDAGVQTACNVGGHVMAAERKAFQMHEPTGQEYRDGGCTRAHVDDGGAKIGFVVGKHGEARHIRARHHGLDRQMATFDRQHQIARRRHVGRGDVHVDSETMAHHAARVADSVRPVDGVTDRQ